MSTKSLPRFVALKSVFNSKYLLSINQDKDREDLDIRGFLQYSGEEILSPYVKYEVERAKTNKGLVHLRSCYNNKYWVRASDDTNWIVAGADELEEDESKWSCTLFEPIYVDDATVRLRHVQLGNYASLWRVDGSPDVSYFYAGSSTPNIDNKDISKIVDLDSLMILPKHVAFKGDNGNYLSARMIEGHQYLQFESNQIGDPRVWTEVFTTRDGSVRIKSKQNRKFWRRSPNWIWADSNDSTTNNPDTLFSPIKVDDNVVALRNFGNNQFCKRLTTEGKTNCLNAAISTISQEAHLVVEELAISRDIDDIEFHLIDARIYNLIVFTIATGTVTNETQETKTAEVKLSYTDTKCSTWNSSVSLKLGVKTTIQTGVPMIVAGKIEISKDFSGAYQWGKTEVSKNVVETMYKVTVPPKTMVTVNLLATKGSCDVPFSYSQHDALVSGPKNSYDMDDGVFTGINYFNFKYETKQEPMVQNREISGVTIFPVADTKSGIRVIG